MDRNRIPLQFNLIDRVTNLDGRFLSYTADYTDHIKANGTILSGPDYIGEMNGLNYKSGVLSSIAFNLRGARNRVLHSVDNSRNDRGVFVDELRKIIGHAVKLPKKLIWLRGRDDIVTSPEGAFAIMRGEVLEAFDVSALRELDRIRRTKREDGLWNDSRRCFDLYGKSLEAIECMVGRYIEFYPEPSQRELKR